MMNVHMEDSEALNQNLVIQYNGHFVSELILFGWVKKKISGNVQYSPENSMGNTLFWFLCTEIERIWVFL